MKSKFSFNISILWISVMFVIGLAILLIAPKGQLLSDTENRMLTAMPEVNSKTVMSGEFSENFELFLNDKFFGRNSIVTLASDIKALFSVLDFDDILEFGDGVEDTFVNETLDQSDDEPISELGSNSSDTVSESDIEESPIEELPNSTSENNITYPATLTYRLSKSSGGSTTLFSVNKKDVAESARIVNKFANLLPEGGNVYYLNVLQAWTVNKYARKTGTYSSWSNNVDPYMQTVVNDNVKVFSFTEIFDKPIQNGEYVFFRTDTHWTPLGAHYAYSEIMSYQGIDPIPYDAYEVEPLYNFLGAYYNIYQTSALKEQADRLDIITPVVPVKYYKYTSKDTYKEVPVIDRSKGVDHMVFLGGNLPSLTVLRSEAGTNRKGLIIKDSFGLIPSIYFSAHYDEFYVVDPRFYNEKKLGYSISEIIKQYKIDDIYFIVSDINGHGKEFTTYSIKRLI